MEITLKTTTSPNNKENKDFINGSDTFTGSIIYPCSVDEPIIKLSGSIIGYNYVTGLFGRKYFIIDRTLDKGFTYLKLKTDVVSTYSLVGTQQFVERSATAYKPELNDNLIIPNKPRTIVKACNGSAFGNSLGTDRCYIITLK